MGALWPGQHERELDRKSTRLNSCPISPLKFHKYGNPGIEVSEVFSAIAQHVDDLAVVRSMYTDIPAHDVATVMMNTGSLRSIKPSMGAWALYGLGSMNEN